MCIRRCVFVRAIQRTHQASALLDADHLAPLEMGKYGTEFAVIRKGAEAPFPRSQCSTARRRVNGNKLTVPVVESLAGSLDPGSHFSLPLSTPEFRGDEVAEHRGRAGLDAVDGADAVGVQGALDARRAHLLHSALSSFTSSDGGSTSSSSNCSIGLGIRKVN